MKARNGYKEQRVRVREIRRDDGGDHTSRCG